MSVKDETSSADWEHFLGNFPQAHILQTPSWAQLKTSFGWQVGWVISHENGLDIGAQILFRQLIPGFRMAYIAKGPVYEQAADAYPPDWNLFWRKVDWFCKKRGATFLKVEPDLWVNKEAMNPVISEQEKSKDEDSQPYYPESLTPPSGFIKGIHTIQPPRTLVIQLGNDETSILAQMKQKTRYNIKLAQKRGVMVCASDDLAAFHKLMVLTGQRDGFGVHSLAYFQKVFELFHPGKLCELFIAKLDQELLAALLVFRYGQRAWYLYGASSNEHRELMATYSIQWEAMRWAKEQGSTEYDLWGVPDMELPLLEENFKNKTENLWGVYRFKRGFGGELRRSAGPWDRVYNPLFYTFYKWKTQRRSESSVGHL